LAPYLSLAVKNATTDANNHVNEAANLAGHALAGALVAYLQGGSAAAGAVGGSSGEVAASIVSGIFYPGIAASELSEEQKANISAVSSLAAGLAGGIIGDSSMAGVQAAAAGKTAVENNSLAITCEHEPTACAKNPWLEGGVGPGGLAGGAAAAGVGAAVGEALNGDKDKTAQDGDQPNVGKNLTDGEKAELGGTGSGTPGGWGPEDEENARNQDNSSSKAEEKFNQNDLISSANKPINDQGMSAAARAWEKHAGRQGGTFEPLKGNVSQKNEAANQFVTEVLNNPNTVRTELSRGGVEFRSPDGKGVRYNGDGSFSGFLDPKR